MENENSPADANTEGDGSSTEADANVSDMSILDTINTATNRSYKTEEEAIKGIKETTSYVGKVGKYKDAITALEQKQGGEAEAISYLADLTKETTDTTEQTGNPLEEKVAQLEEANFLTANAELAPHMDLVKQLKKDGETYAQTVENNKTTFEALTAHAKNHGSKSIIHSNNRTVAETSDYEKDFAAARKSGDWAGFMQKHKKID